MTKKIMAVSFFVIFTLIIAFSSDVSAQSTAEKLIGSWNGEVRTDLGSFNLIISFSIVNGELKGEMVSSSSIDSILGSLKNLNVANDRVSFTTLTGADFNLKFYRNELFGTMSYKNISGMATFKNVTEKK